MNFKPTPDHTWKGLICGVESYMLFAVAPVITILRYFFTIDYDSLMIGLIVFLICFVIGRTTYWAQGDRVIALMLSFFRSNAKNKNNIKEFNHDKEQKILEVRLAKNDIGILYMLMLFFAFGIAIAVHYLSFGEIELRFPGIDRWKLLGSLILSYYNSSRSTPCCCRATVGEGSLEFNTFRIQMAIGSFLLLLSL